MNRIQSTLSITLLAAVSSCGSEAGDTYLDDVISTHGALIVPRPRVDRVQGAICSTTGGCEVTIEGANFRAGMVTVLVNKIRVPACRTVTLDKLVCTVPAAGAAKGAVSIEVTNDPGNTVKSWSQSDGFYYVSQMVDPWPLRTLRTKGVPIAAVIAELNGDTYPDIAVISEGHDIVEVFLGQPGARSFSAPFEVSVGVSPSALVAANFDQDKDKIDDLAIANAGSHDLTVLWSNKGSSYGARSTRITPIGDHPCKQPNSLYVGDANKNNYPDFVMGCAGAPGVNAAVIGYRNDLGIITQRDSELIPNGTREVQLADATDENYLDLATFGESSNRVGLQYCKFTDGFGFNSKSVTAVGLTGKSMSAIATGDVTNDSRYDLLALLSDTKEIAVLPSSASVAKKYFPDILQRIKVSAAYQKMMLANVNGDSSVDLIAIVSKAGKSDTADILLGAPAGGFASPRTLSFGFAVPRAAVGDVDGDKLADLLLLGADTPYTKEDDDGKAIHILLNREGTFSLPMNLSAGAKPAALITAELDADPEAEVISLDRKGKVMVLDEGTTGGFSPRPPVDLESLGVLVSADAMALSANRKTLAVLHSDADKFSTLKVDGKGDLNLDGFHDAVSSAQRSDFTPSDIAMGDFVSGGSEEIVLSFWKEDAPGTGYLAWYKQSGAKWSPGSMLRTSEGQEPLALSVVQLPSAPYAFFVNARSNTIGYWKAGSKPGWLNTGRNPTALVSCELNSAAMDKLSVISADTADSTVTVHVLKKTGGFETMPSVPVCAQPSALWCGDANDDGVADLVVACNGDGSTPPIAELYYGGGNGSFLREKSPVQRPGWGPITVIAGLHGLRSIIAADEESGTTWATAVRR